MQLSFKRRTLRYTVLVFWLAAMYFLVRYEAYPELFTHTLSGYRGVIPENMLIKNTWSRVLVNGVPAGYSHTSMNIADGDTKQNIEISNRMLFRFSMMGQILRITARTELLLSPRYDLLKFSSSVSGQGIDLSVTGQQKNGQTYEIETNFGGNKTVRQIKIPEDALLYSPFSMLALRKLRPGQSLAIKTIDPFSMSSTHVIVKALERGQIKIGDELLDTLRLEFNYKGMRLESWIDNDGNILRQETPLGWVIESCSAEQALDAAGGKHTPPDIMRSGSLFTKLLGGNLYDKN
jgi:hypothetical protein